VITFMITQTVWLFTMLYHARDMVWYVRQKITIELIYPLTDCCHIYIHDDLSVYSFYECERTMCWNTASDVAAIISRINRQFRLTHVVFTWLSPNKSHTSNRAWLLSDTAILTTALNDPDWLEVRWQADK